MSNRTDSFDRADSSSATGTPSDGGSAWVAASGTWGISSNTAYLVSATSQAVEYLETSESAGAVQHTMSTLGGDTGLIGRCVDDSNYILLIHSGSNMFLYHKTAGSFNLIASAGGITGSNGDVFKLTIDSSGNMVGYQNGVSRVTGTNTSHATATKWGIRSNNVTGARFNDWSFTGSGGSSTFFNPMSGLGGAAAQPVWAG